MKRIKRLMTDRILVALETATNVCSVAVARGEHVVTEFTLRRPRVHAERLVPMVQKALEYSNVAAGDVEAVAVSKGPGSYTGLRIGVSTAKGLALAADAALIGVPSLKALAASVVPLAEVGDAIWPLFNSRRREVYAALFRVSAARELIPLADTAALDLDDLPGWVEASGTGRLWLLGEGVERAAPVREASRDLDIRVLDAEQYAPSAAWVAREALPRLIAGDVEDVASFEPFYLKEFIAEKPQGSVFAKLPS